MVQFHTEVGASAVNSTEHPPSVSVEEKRLRRKRKSQVNFRLNKTLVRAETTDEVLSVVGESIKEFNIVNIGTALYRLALVGGNASPSSRDILRNDSRFCELIDEIVDTLKMDGQVETLDKVWLDVIVYVYDFLGGSSS